MIISKVLGGMGNQMFQYAVGRAISLDYGVPLLLDISGFASYRLHLGFELHRVFNCPAEIANEANLRSLLGWQSSSLMRRVVSRSSMTAFRKKNFVIEPHYHFWDGIKNIPRDSYLVGYWLSVKYFKDRASEVRRDFAFKTPLSEKNAEIAAQISQVNAVGLHVRRGDYAKDPKTAATQGLCSLDYYRAAIYYVSERVEKPHFYVFSDDIDWVKTNLKLDFPCRFIGHNQGVESYNDMRLMSLCKHNIIANSTFSWWGAWLNDYTNKIVVTPQAWLANTDIVSDYKKFMDDLVPSDWVRL